jgi:V8-like Glu-specific endopeptidase
MLIQPIPVDRRQFPYICFLQIRYPKTSAGAFSVGTGTLIAPRIVLTAGHVVYDYWRGGAATQFAATFGTTPPLTVGTGVGRTVPEWEFKDSRLPPLQAARSPHDFGVIVLPERIDGRVKPLPFGPADTEFLRQSLLNVAGFPSAANPLGTLYGANAIPSDVQDDRIDYPIQTWKGMSGGTAYTFDSATQVRTQRAIHTSFVGGQGSAVRINQRVMTQVQKWIGEFPS